MKLCLDMVTYIVPRLSPFYIGNLTATNIGGIEIYTRIGNFPHQYAWHVYWWPNFGAAPI